MLEAERELHIGSFYVPLAKFINVQLIVGRRGFERVLYEFFASDCGFAEQGIEGEIVVVKLHFEHSVIVLANFVSILNVKVNLSEVGGREGEVSKERGEEGNAAS